MNHDFRKSIRRDAARRCADAARFDDLLHPARAFDRPSDVVEDSDLTLNEKRAILASWASDACAAAANPLLREAAGGWAASWDEVMDALKQLDAQAAGSAPVRFDPELFWWPRRGLRGGEGGGPNHGSTAA
ncbi:hypothetical protein [uncultured Rhodoblastus sp.]|uniref:hypothetical protein n=1 Tax=uncultured Rhodoblastus sp. TaxID=543037 RepID=UPI0025F94222|nr:hypothetical protein [uncultured Rhodoblastus sp.]